MLLRHGDQQAAPAHQLDRQGLGFDLDPAVSQSDVERHAGSEPRFPSNLVGNDESAGGIHGNPHGRKHTMASAGQSP